MKILQIANIVYHYIKIINADMKGTCVTVMLLILQEGISNCNKLRTIILTDRYILANWYRTTKSNLQTGL